MRFGTIDQLLSHAELSVAHLDSIKSLAFIKNWFSAGIIILNCSDMRRGSIIFELKESHPLLSVWRRPCILFLHMLAFPNINENFKFWGRKD